MTLSKRDWGLLAITLLVPLVLGFIIGQGVGGYMASKPYTAERAMIEGHINHLKKGDDWVKSYSCAIMAWHFDEPRTEQWWQDCMHDF